jgi:hypothetical protein
MSLYAPIRNEAKYENVRNWLQKNFSFIAEGSPEGFLQASEWMGLRGNTDLKNEDSLIAQAVRKVPTAFINVEWMDNTSSFHVKSADMVHVDSMLENLTLVEEQARQVRLILELQDILREYKPSSAWFITNVNEKKAQGFGDSSSRARYYLYTAGDLPEGENDVTNVAPKQLAYLGKPLAESYIKALQAYNPELAQEDTRFEGLKGYYLHVNQILDIKFPSLSDRSELIASLLD